jgi:kynureninase
MTNTVPMHTLQDALAHDAADPLAALRARFALPEGVLYLDGNSLGALPKASAAYLQRVITDEWGNGLIRSWNSAGWIDLPQKVGDKIAPLVGAAPGEVIVADSTSVNLYKVLSAAVALARATDPRRTLIVSERSNFPTDLYIPASVAAQHGCDLRTVDADEIGAQLDERLAVLLLTHVNYRSGRMHDMAAVNRAAHAAGALTVWDLAHSAGAVPVELDAAGDAAADFAIGCGYKYLNGGPGAPAFVWAHRRIHERLQAAGIAQPLAGWFGHAAPFEFAPGYRAAPGIRGFACGTPPVLSLAALDCGLDVFAEAEALGGIKALRAKSLALTSLFIERVETRCAGLGLTLATPRDSAQRGSQVSFAHAEGYPVMQALIARGVIGDFRRGDRSHPADAHDLLRFGFTPLYTSYADVWNAVEQLAAVLESGEWREPRFNERNAVT